ncbi:MAG TPA: hypothetical protein VF322_05035 [Gammaproteobacteria bacterium]
MSVTARVQRTLAGRIKAAELCRYGVVTVAGQAALFAGTYGLVESGLLPPGAAYALVLALIYAGLYVSYGGFVFKERLTPRSLRRFVTALAVMWLASNALFYVLTAALGVHYLAAIALNILLLGAARFCVQRFYVFPRSAA